MLLRDSETDACLAMTSPLQFRVLAQHWKDQIERKNYTHPQGQGRRFSQTGSVCAHDESNEREPANSAATNTACFAIDVGIQLVVDLNWRESVMTSHLPLLTSTNPLTCSTNIDARSSKT